MSQNKLFSINVVRQLSGSCQAVAVARQLHESCHTIVRQVTGWSQAGIKQLASICRGVNLQSRHAIDRCQSCAVFDTERLSSLGFRKKGCIQYHRRSPPPNF